MQLSCNKWYNIRYYQICQALFQYIPSVRYYRFMNTTTFFKRNIIKKTIARIAILNIVKKAKKPTDVVEIIEKLKHKNIKIDRVTVFRNIKLLVIKGLIHKVEFNEGKYRYESAALPHHHHLVCVKCGNVNDIESDSLHHEIEKISKKVNVTFNFQIEEHKVEFFGKCKICKKK